MTFFEILTAAINDLAEHGFDSVERVDGWVAKLREAAGRAAGSARDAEAMLSDGLAAIYARLVERGGISRFNPGVARFTLEQVKPALRAELDRRIMASAQLIKRNRAEAIEKTLHRFQGWATSIPAGGSEAVDRMRAKKDFGKPLKQLDYGARRLAIDQGAKFTANLSDILARSTNAIACEWHSQWRRAGYAYRPDHKERDAKVYLLKGNWAQAKGFVKVGPAGYYDDITKAGEEVFCFPGDSKVPFADGVEKAYRRFYGGPVVTVVLSSGSHLTGTPNHPVLTSEGWISLGALNETHDVVEASEQDLWFAKHHENHGRVATLADIFSACAKDGTSETLDLRPADFHGDGAEGHVDVVLPARALSFGFDAIDDSQSVNDFALAKPHDARFAARAFDQGRLFLRYAAQRIVSGLGVAFFSLGRPLGHAGAHGFASCQQDASGFYDRTGYNRARHSKLVCKAQNGFARSVTLGKRLSIQGYFAFRRWAGTKREVVGVRSPPESVDVDAEDGRDLRHRLPFATKLSHVVEINHGRFTGHVYNLQTRSGWYVTQNVVTHNCSCTVRWIYNLRQLPEDMLTKAGQDELVRVRKQIAQGKLAAPGVTA